MHGDLQKRRKGEAFADATANRVASAGANASPLPRNKRAKKFERLRRETAQPLVSSFEPDGYVLQNSCYAWSFRGAVFATRNLGLPRLRFRTRTLREQKPLEMTIAA
jgi:hypothetical protein